MVPRCGRSPAAIASEPLERGMVRFSLILQNSCLPASSAVKRPRRQRSRDREPHRSSTPPATATPGRWRLLLVVLLLCVTAAGIFGWFEAVRRQGSDAARLAKANMALQQGRYDEAKELALAVLDDDAESSDALLVLAHAAAGRHDAEAAIRYLRRLPDSQQPELPALLTGWARAERKAGWVTPAETYLRTALRWDPQNLETRSELIDLLTLEGRIWEAQRQILPLFRRGHFDINHLVLAASKEVWLADT